MNQDGIVVGSFGLNPNARRAFVWDGAHGMKDLNMLIPAQSDRKLEAASAINESSPRPAPGGITG